MSATEADRKLYLCGVCEGSGGGGMIEYPKIETIWNRDPESFLVRPGEFRLPEFNLVSHWLVTEKIDGTNVRLTLLPDGGANYQGRTNAAQMPPFLLNMLQERFPPSLLAAAFDPGTTAVIFGEGYGPKIQKGGGNYRKDPGFRIFDVAVLTPKWIWWLNWTDVEDVAGKIGAETVPGLAREVTLETALGMVNYPSATAGRDGGDSSITHEGIVVRTDPLLFTRSGARVIWKLKHKDCGA